MQKNKISFKGQKIFIGIDVHAKKWEVASLTESGFVKRHSQEPSAKVLFDFLRKNFRMVNTMLFMSPWLQWFCNLLRLI